MDKVKKSCGKKVANKKTYMLSYQQRFWNSLSWGVLEVYIRKNTEGTRKTQQIDLKRLSCGSLSITDCFLWTSALRNQPFHLLIKRTLKLLTHCTTV